MKQNTIISRVFVAVFVLMLVLQYPLWFVFRPFLDGTNHENRTQTLFPTPATTPLPKFPGAIESYISDHAPFRNQFMTLNANINWKLWHQTGNDSVLLGKENWLFYADSEDSSPIADFQGLTPFTAAQLDEITQNLTNLETALQAKNIRFALLVPPSKEMVYRHLMPSNIPIASPLNRGDQVASHLAANTNLCVVWPEAPLRELAASQQVYFQFDSHWNEAGASFTAALLLEALGIPGPAPQQLSYAPSTSPAPIDLLNMSGAWALFPPDYDQKPTSWQPSIAIQKTYTDEQSFYHSYTSDSANPQKLLFFMDSFGSAIQQPLAHCFAESSFVHINAFTQDTLTSEQPDIFVLELTQRNLHLLLEYLPRLVEWAQNM